MEPFNAIIDEFSGDFTGEYRSKGSLELRFHVWFFVGCIDTYCGLHTRELLYPHCLLEFLRKRFELTSTACVPENVSNSNLGSLLRSIRTRSILDAWTGLPVDKCVVDKALEFVDEMSLLDAENLSEAHLIDLHDVRGSSIVPIHFPVQFHEQVAVRNLLCSAKMHIVDRSSLVDGKANAG